MLHALATGHIKYGAKMMKIEPINTYILLLTCSQVIYFLDPFLKKLCSYYLIMNKTDSEAIYRESRQICNFVFLILFFKPMEFFSQTTVMNTTSELTKDQFIAGIFIIRIRISAAAIAISNERKNPINPINVLFSTICMTKEYNNDLNGSRQLEMLSQCSIEYSVYWTTWLSCACFKLFKVHYLNNTYIVIFLWIHFITSFWKFYEFYYRFGYFFCTKSVWGFIHRSLSLRSSKMDLNPIFIHIIIYHTAENESYLRSRFKIWWYSSAFGSIWNWLLAILKLRLFEPWNMWNSLSLPSLILIFFCIKKTWIDAAK